MWPFDGPKKEFKPAPNSPVVSQSSAVKSAGRSNQKVIDSISTKKQLSKMDQAIKDAGG